LTEFICSDELAKVTRDKPQKFMVWGQKVKKKPYFKHCNKNLHNLVGVCVVVVGGRYPLGLYIATPLVVVKEKLHSCMYVGSCNVKNQRRERKNGCINVSW
jgi:hypothetical protein